MPSSAHPVTHPANQLAEECRAAHALLALLQREQTHLVEADIEQIEALVAEKSQAVSQLSRLAAERHQMLEAAGYPASEAGMQQCMDTPADEAPPHSRQYWQELLDIMGQAREMNRTNGLLIHTHLRHNQASLQALQATSPDGGNLYGPNGQSSARLPGRGVIIG